MQVNNNSFTPAAASAVQAASAPIRPAVVLSQQLSSAAASQDNSNKASSIPKPVNSPNNGSNGAANKEPESIKSPGSCSASSSSNSNSSSYNSSCSKDEDMCNKCNSISYCKSNSCNLESCSKSNSSSVIHSQEPRDGFASCQSENQLTKYCHCPNNNTKKKSSSASNLGTANKTRQCVKFKDQEDTRAAVAAIASTSDEPEDVSEESDSLIKDPEILTESLDSSTQTDSSSQTAGTQTRSSLLNLTQGSGNSFSCHQLTHINRAATVLTQEVPDVIL